MHKALNKRPRSERHATEPSATSQNRNTREERRPPSSRRPPNGTSGAAGTGAGTAGNGKHDTHVQVRGVRAGEGGRWKVGRQQQQALLPGW